MKVLIAVLSCESFRTNGNNQAMRDTWLPLVSGADYRIFMGQGSICSQPDEVFLDVPDNYQNVTYKTRAMYKWALEHEYDFIFKCFPDTYVCPSRLLSSGFEKYDYVGNFACRPQGGFAYATGGSGYWLSKKAYGPLATAHIPIEDTIVVVSPNRRPLRSRAPHRPNNAPVTKVLNVLTWAEDRWTGGLVYTHEDLKIHHDTRYEENVYGRGPEYNNSTISIHLSRTNYVEGSPSKFDKSWVYDKHTAWMQGVVAPVNGFHNKDIREFYDWEHEMFNPEGREHKIRKIAVITPTVASRSKLLEECKASVKAQTWDGEILHAVEEDCYKVGAATMRNTIVQGIDQSYEWLAFCDDDDLIMPEHIAVLAAASEGADVIYSDCQEEGFVKTWHTREFNYDEVKASNYIPVTCLFRRSMFEKIGGFDLKHYPGEDQWTFLNAASAGARFKYVPQVTWTYRQLPQYRLQTSQSS
jgi:hypothetical protein